MTQEYYYAQYERQERERQYYAEQDRQRRAALQQRVGQIETRMNSLAEYARQVERAAQQADWEARWAQHKARAATPAPAPPPADRGPTYAEIQRAARAPRPVQVSSVIDPLVSSPGSNIRMR
jgi:hypothetical protein